MYDTGTDLTGKEFKYSQIMLPVDLSHLKRGVFNAWSEKAGIPKNGSRLSMVSWSSSLQLVA
jgi:hypothetical protein